ncbi:hypothetical protein BCR35DRAFT_254052, partial [Leucosporidium creatinivorum]
ILGFNLGDMSWRKFGTKSLMQRGWKWRRERVVLYQLAIILSITAEAIATYSLTKYATHQINIQNAFPGTYYGQNDLINSGIAAIVPSILVAFCFGTAFFFLAQYPRKVFPRWYHGMMLGWAGLICLALLVSSLGVGLLPLSLAHPPPPLANDTQVIVFHSSAFLILPPNSPFTIPEITTQFPHDPPLRYRDYGPNIAFVVLLW